MKKPGNILVTTYWAYNNALISTYTLPYLRIMLKQLPKGKVIYLLTLTGKKNTDTAGLEEFRKRCSDENIHLLNYHYSPFGITMAFRFVGILASLLWISLSKKVTHIHGWCTPGGGIAWLVSAITRKPLVLDSFEPHALNMIENGSWRKKSPAFRILFALEKLQLARASHVICAAGGMIQHSQETYGIKKERYYVKPACVDLELFKPLPRNIRPENKKEVCCVYAGKFGGIYLEQEVFDFFKTAFTYFREGFRVLLLTSHTKEEIDRFCEASALPRHAVIEKFVNHHEVPAYLAQADFGICPVKPVPTKAFCSPIKNGEYWAMGMPVVITRNISDDSRIIAENNAGYVLQDLTKAEYLSALKHIEQIIREPGYRDRIRALAVRYRNFSIAEKIYKIIYG